MSGRGLSFIARMRGGLAAGASLDLIASDGEGFEAALGDHPDELFDALTERAMTAVGPPVQLQGDSFASAACDADGSIVAAEPNFGEWLGVDPLEQVVKRLSAVAPRLTVVLDDRSGRPVAVAAARWSLAAHWPVAGAVRARLETQRDLFAVIAFRPGRDAWSRAARAFNLTGQELRLAEALATQGGLRAAAGTLGVAYETARKLLASAMEKTGSRRQASFVRSVVGVVAGDVMPEGQTERLFSDVFSLTPRQAALTARLVRGDTRRDAAAAVGTSDHVAKDELRLIFEACNVASITDLARVHAELEALGALASACDVEVDGFGAERLRLIKRRGRTGHIAVSDHGPPDGTPVLVFHATMMGRHLPASLVSAMHARGLRPIAFDRAGFGLTDWGAEDVVAMAVNDVGDILAALGLRRVLALARGGSLPLMTLARDRPDLIVGGVLVGVGIPWAADSKRHGIIGSGKKLFFEHPRLIEPLVRMMMGSAPLETLGRLVERTASGSPADEAAIAVPRQRADLIRAIRQSNIGMRGFIHEMAATMTQDGFPMPEDGSRWTVLNGGSDPIFDNEESDRFWARHLAGVKIRRIGDGGRWLHLSHPDLIADEVASLRDRLKDKIGEL